MRRLRSFIAAAVIAPVLMAACGASQASAPTTPTTVPGIGGQTTGLTVQGDPESSSGATWTYVGSIDGAAVDLQGILLKPRGTGPFPAVIISHGAGGNAGGYSRSISTEMVGWGLVCIATNYTHASGVPAGAPGTADDAGASAANVARAHATYQILRSLGYVDMGRVAAHGHSMGAFVTTALLATYPSDFRVASHTAGGVRPDTTTSGAAPSENQARAIRTPYQLHHGDQDMVVSIGMDQRLIAILQAGGTTSELLTYPGLDHNDMSREATMLQRVRSWYIARGVL